MFSLAIVQKKVEFTFECVDCGDDVEASDPREGKVKVSTCSCLFTSIDSLSDELSEARASLIEGMKNIRKKEKQRRLIRNE